MPWIVVAFAGVLVGVLVAGFRGSWY